MVVSQSDFASWIQQQTALDAPIMKYLLPYSHTSNHRQSSTATDVIDLMHTRES